MVLSGTDIRRGVRLAAGTQLDTIAPTLLDVLGSKWAYPNVHQGTAIPHVESGAPPPRLVLLVAWKGVGSESFGTSGFGAAPFLHSLAKDGASTMDADTGSVPIDPAAVLTTIGTGAPPSEHGITGTYVRNNHGALTRAWSAHAPLPILAAIGDDYDLSQDERPLVGMIGTDPADLGLVGGTWYPGHDDDRDTTVRDPAKVPSAVGQMLSAGFGKDDVPDILGVSMQGSVRDLDSQLKADRRPGDQGDRRQPHGRRCRHRRRDGCPPARSKRPWRKSSIRSRRRSPATSTSCRRRPRAGCSSTRPRWHRPKRELERGGRGAPRGNRFEGAAADGRRVRGLRGAVRSLLLDGAGRYGVR